MSNLVFAWSDGYCMPYGSDVSFLRCGVCGQWGAKSSFDFAGCINHGCYDLDLRLTTIGPEPLKVMKRLRAVYGWELAETKARLASLPIELPTIRLPEDAIKLRDALLEDGAGCDMEKVFTESPDPPERLNAPWAYCPTHPCELSEVVHHGMPDECAVRIYVYQLSNAAYRHSNLEWVGLMARTPFEVENIRALLGLMDSRDEVHWLLRANIARESGDFSLAAELLGQREPMDEKYWHSCLLSLVSRQIEHVSILQLPNAEVSSIA